MVMPRILRAWFAEAVIDTIVTAVAFIVPIIVIAVVGISVNRFDVTPVGIWYPTTLGVVGGYLAFIALNEVRKGRRRADPSTPDARAVYQDVRDLTDAAGLYRHVDTALLVLDEARGGYERAFSGSESIEGKASALLSIVAGASSAVGIFGLGKEGRSLVVSHVIGAALVCVLLALSLLFYILRAKQLPQPSVAKYIVPAMADRDNRIGVALRLAATYEAAGQRITSATAREPAALLAAATLTAAAGILILLNASFPCPTTASGALRAACPPSATSAPSGAPATKPPGVP
jgi:hypothetical protein